MKNKHRHIRYPPPKVKSAVIRLRRNDRKHLDCKESLFFSLVKTAFNQRRKTLRNALKSFQFEREEKLILLLTKRAEQLGVSEFEYLCQNIKNAAG